MQKYKNIISLYPRAPPALPGWILVWRLAVQPPSRDSLKKTLTGSDSDYRNLLQTHRRAFPEGGVRNCPLCLLLGRHAVGVLLGKGHQMVREKILFWATIINNFEANTAPGRVPE